jgi:hypothetical protein
VENGVHEVRPRLDLEALGRLRQEALFVLGDEGANAGGELRRALDEYVELVAGIAAPAGAYTRLPLLETGRDGVSTRAGLIASPMFARFVERCVDPRALTFAVVTIGEAFDSEFERDRPLFDRLVLDAVCSVLVEIVADLVEDAWKGELAARGLESGMRVSPGYCDWPVEGQGVVFEALDAGSVGITLNSSFVMTPLKSLSSVAVVAGRVPETSACAFCGKDGCAWRRIPASVSKDNNSREEGASRGAEE